MPFVGREQERRRVRELLSTSESAPFVIHVQGMPGIGKSALLEQLSSDAVSLGYTVHTVSRALGEMERAQELHTRLVDARGRTLIVVDDWHTLVIAEVLLVDWIERATGPVVLLVASRLRPRAAFTESALFPGRLFALELSELTQADSIALLSAHGTTPDDAREVYRACRGQPFAMLMLSRSPGQWETVGLLRRSVFPEHAESIAVTLVQRLIGQIADGASRDALMVAALAGSLNEHELRMVCGLPATEARGTFDRLRELTVIRTTATGLELHPIVRAAVLTDLRLRDPLRARMLVARALEPIEEALGWSGIPRDRALRQLHNLAAAAPQDVALSGMFELEDVGVAQARPRDLGDALALIEALEGPVAREIALRWATFDPSSVTIVRSKERLDGVMIRAELRGPHVPEALSEPAVVRLVEALGASGQLCPGKLLRTSRFFLAREHHQMPCMELAALGAAITRRTLETHEPFLSVQHIEARAVAAWRGLVATTSTVVREDASAVVDGRRLVPFVLDFTDLGALFSTVVRGFWGVEGSSAGAPPAPPVPPELQGRRALGGTADLEKEVVHALHHMRDTVWLETSRLGAVLFPSHTGPERGERLRAWIEEAIADTENMRHGDLVCRALRASFGASRSAEEAASFAGMGLSTLKRYRKMGVVHITALAQRLAV